jgi:hypothetical protein
MSLAVARVSCDMRAHPKRSGAGYAVVTPLIVVSFA